MIIPFSELVKVPGRIQQVREMQDIQDKGLHPTNDEYIRGLYNGMELALSIIENREPVYKKMRVRS